MPQFLIEKVREYYNKIEIENGNNPREKKTFWVTENETNSFDIYHKWIGTPPTNPIDAERLMIMGSGKKIEEMYVQILRDMNVLEGDPSGKQTRIEIEREGVPISGYIDAIVHDGTKLVPVEIKTFYGDVQEREIENGIAKSSYVKQLAIYMDAKGFEVGYLLYINRGTGQTYQFTIYKRPNTPSTFYYSNLNGDTEFDLRETYKRWSGIYQTYILPKVEPKSEFRYKYPIESIEWQKLSKKRITDARNNRRVVGDWEVLYSPYKDLIVKQEGWSELGYSPEEIEKIKELTTGYTKW